MKQTLLKCYGLSRMDSCVFLHHFKIFNQNSCSINYSVAFPKLYQEEKVFVIDIKKMVSLKTKFWWSCKEIHFFLLKLIFFIFRILLQIHKMLHNNV